MNLLKVHLQPSSNQWHCDRQEWACQEHIASWVILVEIQLQHRTSMMHQWMRRCWYHDHDEEFTSTSILVCKVMRFWVRCRHAIASIWIHCDKYPSYPVSQICIHIIWYSRPSWHMRDLCWHWWRCMWLWSCAQLIIASHTIICVTIAMQSIVVACALS